jgi:hypothetical protein
VGAKLEARGSGKIHRQEEEEEGEGGMDMSKPTKSLYSRVTVSDVSQSS